MSILNKLKDLVAALETEGNSEEVNKVQQVTPPPVPNPVPDADELLLEEEDIIEEAPEIQEIPAYLECSSEETALILARIENVKLAKIALAELSILFEQKKRKFLSEIEQRNYEFLNDLESLRLEYGVPEEGYTVQLPPSPESKVSFIKN